MCPIACRKPHQRALFGDKHLLTSDVQTRNDDTKKHKATVTNKGTAKTKVAKPQGGRANQPAAKVAEPEKGQGQGCGWSQVLAACKKKS